MSAPGFPGEAAALWTELATGFEAKSLGPGPAAAMAERAAGLARRAPEPDWAPVSVRHAK